MDSLCKLKFPEKQRAPRHTLEDLVSEAAHCVARRGKLSPLGGADAQVPPVIMPALRVGASFPPQAPETSSPATPAVKNGLQSLLQATLKESIMSQSRPPATPALKSTPTKVGRRQRPSRGPADTQAESRATQRGGRPNFGLSVCMSLRGASPASGPFFDLLFCMGVAVDISCSAYLRHATEMWGLRSGPICVPGQSSSRLPGWPNLAGIGPR